MPARRKVKKVPMAPVEQREVPVAAPTVRLPVRSELPPAHVCTREGDPLKFVRELSPGKRLYSCGTCGGTYLFLDEV